jgi:hypothetical protein
MSKHKHRDRAKYKKSAHKNPSKDGTKGDNLWTIIEQQSLDAFGTLTSCAAANGFARDHELMKLLNEEQSKTIIDAYAKLAEKTNELATNLKTIRQAHAGKKGDSKDLEDASFAIVINNQYLQWHDDWQENVLPILETITTVFADLTGHDVKLNPDAMSSDNAPAVIVSEKAAPQYFTEDTTNLDTPVILGADDGLTETTTFIAQDA